MKGLAPTSHLPHRYLEQIPWKDMMLNDMITIPYSDLVGFNIGTVRDKIYVRAIENGYKVKIERDEKELRIWKKEVL